MRIGSVLLVGAGLSIAGAAMGATAGVSVATIVVVIIDGLDGLGAPLFVISAVFGAACQLA
jgi:hypothetical protein